MASISFDVMAGPCIEMPVRFPPDSQTRNQAERYGTALLKTIGMDEVARFAARAACVPSTA